jgi:WD40 repeat protein
LFLAPAALLVFSAQAGAAKSQTGRTKQAANPIWTLAMDGPRVAYASGGRIRIWNVATGAASVVKGRYGGSASHFVNNTAAQVAIAGTRVAWVKDQPIGNAEESQRLYTASLGGRAHQVDRVHRFGTDDASQTTGGWIEGLAGSGKTLAVSTWRSNGTVATDQQLSLVTGKGLKPLAGGSGSIVAQGVDGGHIAVLMSGPWSNSSSVGIYSRDGSTLGEVDLGPPGPGTNGIQIALSGDELVVLTTALIEPSGPTTVTLEVYNWTTGQLLDTWPVGIHSDAGEVSFAVHGELAAVEDPSRLHLVDLTSGKDRTIARASHTGSPPAIDSWGLVYALDPHLKGPGKLVFVPMAKLLADVS